MRRRGRWIVLLLGLSACSVEGRVERITRAARGGDATVDAELESGALETGVTDSVVGVGCGSVSAEGCCSAHRFLFYCDKGILKKIDCAGRPKCGWSNSGVYDCNTSGAPDPSGTWALDCTGLLPDGGLPGPDAGPDAGGPCGTIGIEGCCDGTTLKYCTQGQLKTVSCAINPSCGWFPMGQFYDCGTAGIEDPTGTFPRQCPGSTPTDGASDFYPWSDLGLDISADGGDGSMGKNGCSCRVGAPEQGPPSPLAFWLLMALVVVVARRR